MPYRANLPEYNGWTNYATWNAFLWLSNEQEPWERLLNFATWALDKPDAAVHIARFVTGYIKRNGGEASCRTDLEGWAKQHGKSLRWALDQIDWDEIVAHLHDAVNDALPATQGAES